MAYWWIAGWRGRCYTLWLTGLQWMTWGWLVCWADMALKWQKSTNMEELINFPWKLLFPSSLPHVIYGHYWWQWRKKRGYVILVWDWRCDERAVVLLLDKGLLMCGYVVVAEGDSTLDGGKWRYVALPAFATVNHGLMLSVMGFVGSCVWWFVMLIWLLKSQVCCGLVEGPLKMI